MSGKTKSFTHFNTSSFCVPDKRIHLDRITFCRNRNNKRTIYRRYRLMAVRRLITFPERNKTETQSCPSSFSLQRKLWIYTNIPPIFLGLYPTLSFATAGTVHGNIKINKVCLILWGLVQASGYLQTMDNRYLLHFKNFKTLCLFQLKSIAWNVFITSIPFSLTLIASTYDQDEILFFLSYYTATLIYAIGIGMLRHIIPSPLLLFIVQLSILMPFYLGSLFVPIILIPGIALTALLTCHAHKRLKRLLW